MPVKRITAPNDTAGKNLLKNGNNYNTVHDATAATNAGNADTKFTLHAKSGSNFFIRRGILLYDFRESPATRGDLPRQIKIFRAQLIVNDVSELAYLTLIPLEISTPTIIIKQDTIQQLTQALNS